MAKALTSLIEKQGKYFVALCPELDIASQGNTRASALRNMREAVRLFRETASAAELMLARA